MCLQILYWHEWVDRGAVMSRPLSCEVNIYKCTVHINPHQRGQASAMFFLWCASITNYWSLKPVGRQIRPFSPSAKPMAGKAIKPCIVPSISFRLPAEGQHIPLYMLLQWINNMNETCAIKSEADCFAWNYVHLWQITDAYSLFISPARKCK